MQLSAKERISALVDQASVRSSTNNAWVDYQTVDQQEADLAKRKTGLDVVGMTHTIDARAIKHMLNRHGEGMETRTDHKSVTKEDIERILEIVSSPDTIAANGKNDIGRDTILYTKRFNGTTYYLEEVRSRRQKLAAVTLYIKRNKVAVSPARDDAAETASPSVNVRNAPSSAATDNNTTQGENVKQPEQT
jgi:hypothetical protein